MEQQYIVNWELSDNTQEETNPMTLEDAIGELGFHARRLISEGKSINWIQIMAEGY